MGHGWEKATPAIDDLPLKGDTVVGNDVWIGQNVTIMPGIRIGDGAIIGARAVVTKDVPPYTIVGGVPAKPIRKRFSDDVIEKLLKLKWWDLPPEKILPMIADIQSGNLQGVIRAAGFMP
ncbi:MAG: CatB-related O-acetyltransferase, partial [Treponemataceae bacterium]|nr:CatB-related O-acetyltransferase [Treponemataceae bacterium]